MGRFVESEKLELKSSLSQIDEIIETISAFANAKGGEILIGVNNKGKIVGVEVGKDTMERLVNKIKDNLEPKIFPEIEIKELSNKQIISLKIKENREKPVLAFGRAYKRVGKSTLKINKDEYERIVLEKQKVYWDEQICEEAKLEDLDWSFIKKDFISLYESASGKKITAKPKELLESLKCVKKNKPTRAGILLFGKEPQKFFVNAYISVARYKGIIEGIERLDYKEFVGNLFKQIDECDNYLKQNITIMSRLHPYKVPREDIPEYGFFSIRELITNAVCHRDYSEQGGKIIIKMFKDRIEFYSPGGLPKDINPKNILKRQYSRNPVTSHVLAKVKYIEELGEGWNKIIDEHKRHPLKPKLPKIEADKHSVLVILYSTKEKFKEFEVELSERQKKIIKYLKENKRITRSVCMKLLKVSKDTAVRDLSSLKSKNIIQQRGVGRGIYYALK